MLHEMAQSLVTGVSVELGLGATPNPCASEIGPLENPREIGREAQISGRALYHTDTGITFVI